MRFDLHVPALFVPGGQQTWPAGQQRLPQTVVPGGWVPWQVPLARHTELAVHGLLSLHVAPTLTGLGGHVAERPVQVACVSHWVGVGPHANPDGRN